MPQFRASLTRKGARVAPHELIPLRNGTVIPAGVFKALSEAYVELMVRRGILTTEGTVNPEAMLDAASVEGTHDAARLEASAAPRPGRVGISALPTPTVPPAATRRPRVPESQVRTLEGRFQAAFGDPRWVQVDVDARSSASGSGSLGHFAAELDLGVTLPGVGRVQLVREEVDVAVAEDACTTRSEILPLGPVSEVASNPNTLRNPTAWRSRHSLGRMRVVAHGMPIDVPVEVVGVAGMSCRGTASSAFRDRRVNQRIFEATIEPKATTTAGTMAEGLYARIRLEGSSEIDLSLKAAIDVLAQVDPDLRDTVTRIVSQVTGLQPWTWNVGTAGATVGMHLAGIELCVKGFHRLDFVEAEHAAGEYVQSGAAEAHLRARFLADPSIDVFFHLSAPAGIDVHWDFEPIRAAWRHLGERHRVWGWDGAAFDDEVGLVCAEWSVNLGAGRPETSDAKVPCGGASSSAG